MKRLSILLGLAIILNACYFSEEDKFPQSATDRINDAVENARTVLCSAPNGWRAELYPAKDQIYGGYTMFLKFSDKDGTVIASSESFVTSYAAESYFDVKPENGPMLTFDTYNDVIHFYVDAGTGANLGMGTANGGLEGDSDFIVMEATPQQVRLKGRKSGNNVFLYPLESGVSWPDEIQEYVDAEAEMMLGYTMCIVNDKVYPVSFPGALNNFTSRVFHITTQEASETMPAVEINAPFIWTKNGVKFYAPITVGDVSVSELSFNGKYLENADGSFRISPKYSDNRITIDITDVTYNSFRYRITSTNDDPYVVRAMKKSEIQGMSDSQLRRAVANSVYSDQELQSGNDAGELTELYDQTEYVILALGMDPATLTFTTDLFKAEARTAELPQMSQAYKQWIGTWTVTSKTSEKTGTSYDFVIEIRPDVVEQTYLIRGWGYTAVKNDYECSATFNSADGSFDINHQIIGPSGTGGILTLMPRFAYTKGGSGYGLIGLGYGEALCAVPGDTEEAGMIYGYGYRLSGGGECVITSLDYWDVRDGSNYYIYAMDPYVYQDFFVGPYSMVRTSTEYNVLKSTKLQILNPLQKDVVTTDIAHAVEAVEAIEADLTK